MKAIIILTIIGTISGIFFSYSRDKNLKKLFISAFSLFTILSLAIAGNLTRQIMPLFLVHIVLTIFACGGLLWYIVRGRYYWWIIFSPAVSLGLFLILEFLVGSGHE
jgi:cytosine/uracil/thiamine/allantoin permease